jgi:signal transduction histidine kinase
VNVTDVINNIVKQHAKKTEENQCTISNFITKSLMICGDQAYLERIFFHIIDNAIRYTPDHGSITINAQSTPHEITIAINDTGIGMTPHQLQNAFLEFYKGDTSRHSLDSNGLGLAICKYLVEKHDGKIWAESDGVGKGSTIFLTLPDLKKI